MVRRRMFEMDYIIRKMNKGVPIPEMARDLGVTKSAIYNALRRRGIKPIQRTRQIKEFWKRLNGRRSDMFGGKIKERVILKSTFTDLEYETYRSRMRLLYTARAGAKRKNLEFNVSYLSLEWPTHCPVLGIPINYSIGKITRRDNSPSLDRLRNDVGYTKSNTRIISWRANRLKSDSTPEELAKLVVYVQQAKKVRKTALKF